MYHIRSGFEFELLRLIRHIHDFLPGFEIELIRLIREKNFETSFSKVHDQVTQTSIVYVWVSSWPVQADQESISSSLALNWNCSDSSDMLKISSLPFKLN